MSDFAPEDFRHPSASRMSQDERLLTGNEMDELKDCIDRVKSKFTAMSGTMEKLTASYSEEFGYIFRTVRVDEEFEVKIPTAIWSKDLESFCIVNGPAPTPSVG